MSFYNPSSYNSSSGISRQAREPWISPPARQLLRRLGWVVVIMGAAYTGLILTWMMLEPGW